MRIDFKEKKALSSEEISQKDIVYTVNQANLQYQADKLATEQLLETKKEELATAKTTAPLDMTKIVNLMVEIEGLEDGLSKMKVVAEELGFIDAYSQLITN